MKFSLKEAIESGAKKVNIEMKAAPSSWDPEQRTVDFTMSKETTDRHGDIVRVKGIDLKNFSLNPIALYNHRSYGMFPIGTWENLRKNGDELIGTLRLAPAGTTEEVDIVAAMIGANVLRACSIGFMPHEFKRITDDDGEFTGGWDITKAELYECSVVGIPANQFAVSKDLEDPDGLTPDMIDHVLNNYVKTEHGLVVHKSMVRDDEDDAGDEEQPADDAPAAKGKAVDTSNDKPNDKGHLEVDLEKLLGDGTNAVLEHELEIESDGKKEKRSLGDWFKSLISKHTLKKEDDDEGSTNEPEIVMGSRAAVEAKLKILQASIDD